MNRKYAKGSDRNRVEVKVPMKVVDAFFRQR
jgi:hypothetical protein